MSLGGASILVRAVLASDSGLLQPLLPLHGDRLLAHALNFVQLSWTLDVSLEHHSTREG
jgi:hypothetical protein